MNTAIKWLVGIALIAASASIIVPAFLRYNEMARCDGRLSLLHESASF